MKWKRSQAINIVCTKLYVKPGANMLECIKKAERFVEMLEEFGLIQCEDD